MSATENPPAPSPSNDRVPADRVDVRITNEIKVIASGIDG